MMSPRRRARAFGSLLIPAVLAACTDDDRTASSTSDAGASNAAPGGFRIRADVLLTKDDDDATLTFLTPALSLYSTPASDVVGKPYYVAVFPGGFDQGVDLDLHHEWGTVPADLHLRYESPARFPDGPYDVSVIVYTKSRITKAMEADYFAVVPRAGELSAFTLSHDRVHAGDPGFSNGVVRVNVEGADAELRLDNRHDATDIATSLTDTVLTVP